MNELRFDLVFEYPGAHCLHCARMCLDGDLCCFSHGRDFGTALVKAHIVQQVIERDELLWRVHAL